MIVFSNDRRRNGAQFKNVVVLQYIISTRVHTLINIKKVAIHIAHPSLTVVRPAVFYLYVILTLLNTIAVTVIITLSLFHSRQKVRKSHGISRVTRVPGLPRRTHLAISHIIIILGMCNIPVTNVMIQR